LQESEISEQIMAIVSARLRLLGMLKPSRFGKYEGVLRTAGSQSNSLAYFTTVTRAGEYVAKTADDTRESIKEAARSAKEKAEDFVHQTKETAKSAAQQTQCKTQEIGEKARSTAEEFGRQAKDRTNDAAEKIRSMGEEVKEKAQDAKENSN